MAKFYKCFFLRRPPCQKALFNKTNTGREKRMPTRAKWASAVLVPSSSASASASSVATAVLVPKVWSSALSSAPPWRKRKAAVDAD